MSTMTTAGFIGHLDMIMDKALLHIPGGPQVRGDHVI
jgi:hypothetical protein